MTVKLGDGGSGEDGLKKLGKRAADEESLEGEGAGGADAAEESSGTKRDEKTPRAGADGPPAPPGAPQAPSPPQGSPQDQHHFLRSSVRPQSKRPRKDPPSAVGSGNAGGSGPRGKGAEGGGSSSGNVSGVAPAAPAGGSRSSSRNLGSSGGEKEEGKKVRRQWESWSTEDKNTFFEGLYEHGKDFEAIQNNIALKYKKKGKPASMVKNKEQVRHFYYRTWHKITKYIDFDHVFSRGLKKSSQELYGLICYGELRKKIGGCMDDKNATKLNELIQVGATTVRYKGRNLRIKAPMCRALKKLCDPDGLSDEEDQKPVRLPLKVPIELQPRNNHAWARVQSLAQNPRLRMIVELHRKVSSLIEFLKQKWALHEVRVRKTLEERQLQDSCSAPMQEKVTLHLFPGENCTLTPLPGVARVVHSKAFCTVHWQEGGRCKQSAKDAHVLPPAQILGIQSGQGTARGQVKCPRSGAEGKGVGRPPPAADALQSSGESSPESAPGEGAALSLSSPDAPDRPPPRHQDTGPCLEKTPAEGRDSPTREPGALPCACGQLPDLEDELSLLDPLPRYLKSCQDLIVPEQCRCADTRPGSEQPPLGGAASPEVLAPVSKEAADLAPTGPSPRPGPGLLLDVCTKDLADAPAEELQEKGSPAGPPPSQGQPAARPPKEVPASRLAQQLREEGWNLQTSESLTLAEVYLMMGKPSKLQLEYDWLGPGRQDPRPGSLPTALHKQRLLSCLLKLISTEVNPKLALEANTISTASVRPAQEEQSMTPPGKVVTVSSRSPRCPRNQASLRSSKTFPPSSAPCSSGLRNPPRPLLVPGPSSTGSNDSDGGLFAVPTTLPPNSRHGKLFSPSKEAELTFRQHLNSISMQSDFFLPKPRKLRNRHLRKPLVVQRTLLPRPSENQSHNVCSFSILSNSSVTGRGSFRPIQSSLTKAALSRPIVPKVLPPQATSHLASAIDLAATSAGILSGNPLPALDTEGLSGISPLSSDEVTGAISGQDSTGTHQDGDTLPTVGGSDPFVSIPSRPEQEPVADSFQGSSVLSLSELPKAPLQNGLSIPLSSSESSSTRLSPPDVSALLDISLPGPPEDALSQGEPATHISDSIIEIAISSGQYGEGVPLSPAKLNGSDSSKSLPSPSSSPQPHWIASPTHDPQWYPSDSTDSSLSSLFASFISPEKSRKMLPTPIGTNSGTSLLGPSLLDGNSRDSFVSRSLADVAEVVDSQLVCMMNENSIDYISRFNDLAQELSIAEPGRREALFDGGGGGPAVSDLSQ
ncbi:protein cramped-like [Homo sapiens]|uniref:Protein cramped-like n=2 Tax=Homo sapiens TaxID=9606 RepID=CRML_HUMAN|nr:protein cramped-like [Homo sapiens]Q96RY5.3 RecName: Full=Protein cramped-like; AltName: Full=Cramped chromatin regulator homolog 1; AltName: Full=Hematological and neurological expressed 1-like protein [Homo sapiens]KAI2576366.1 cramped chromatin regulator-like 1 [Homo sapiens]KAI2576367.1 cramped chromatin regulator-like 1 [Homo sapiens]|eukprot:NP_065876.3 protein cramped-like [Homo sapiens]